MELLQNSTHLCALYKKYGFKQVSYFVISEVVSFMQFFQFRKDLVTVEVINTFYVAEAIIQDTCQL